MASDMPNRYIDREGIFEEETSKAIQANDLATLEKQNQVLQEEMALVKQTNEQVSKELADIRSKYDELFDGKGLMRLLNSLLCKQKELPRMLKRVSDKHFDVVLPTGTSQPTIRDTFSK